jgi:hypothetical protein
MMMMVMVMMSPLTLEKMFFYFSRHVDWNQRE